MKPCYLFDIDGTLADLSHRLHHIQKTPKDWDAFFDACPGDAPHGHMCELAGHLIETRVTVLFVSGRSDRVRLDTLAWLDTHVTCGLTDARSLYMRRDGDHRPDHIVKAELLDQILADGYQPIMAFDDRNQVVKMWRARGIPCAQVADGDF